MKNLSPPTQRPARPKRRLSRIACAALATAFVALAGYGGMLTPPGFQVSMARAQPPDNFIDELPAPKLRLISQSQYLNIIHSIFGPDVEVSVRFAPVNRIDGLLKVGGSAAVLTGGALDPLEASARAVAEQVVSPERRNFLVGCRPADPQSADPECARAFFSKVGPLLYRRPISNAELDGLVAIAGEGVGADGDFYSGVAYALSAMLVSPHFLFVRETAEPDPAGSGAWRLDGYSKASRLSFLLWDSAPDADLLAAAARGDLHDPDRLQKQIDLMLSSPLFEDGVRAFFSDFLVLEAFDTMAKDLAIYPAMTLKAIAESREQILRTVVEHLVTQRGDYRDLYTTRRTVISSDLGVLYKLPVNLGSQGWKSLELGPTDPRAGILTQIGFLAQYAHPGRSSATRRGRGVREVLMCQKVPDPPPNVDFSNFENSDKKFSTARERIAVHNENPVCAGCHRLTDPIGLALENFDGAGQFRTHENGALIDASGSLESAKFENAVELGRALRDNPAMKSCFVNRLYAYSVGRKLTQSDEALIEAYVSDFDRRGYFLGDMLRRIVLSQRFFAVRAPQLADAKDSKHARAGGFDAH